MYGYRGLWSLRAVILIIFEVITDIHTYSISTYRLGPSGRMGRVKKIKCYYCCPLSGPAWFWALSWVTSVLSEMILWKRKVWNDDCKRNWKILFETSSRWWKNRAVTTCSIEPTLLFPEVIRDYDCQEREVEVVCLLRIFFSLLQKCRDFLLKYVWLRIMNVNFINGEEFHLHLWCPVSFPQSGCLLTCDCNSESPFRGKIWLHFNICIILSMTLELSTTRCKVLRTTNWQKRTLDHQVFLDRDFEWKLASSVWRRRIKIFV